MENITPPMENGTTLQSHSEEPVISLRGFILGLLIPQTSRVITYIKHHKVIDNVASHNFIHKRVVEEVH